MYVDPGLGSMLIQGIVAVIAALSVIGVGFRSKIAAFFKKGKNAGEETEVQEIAGESDDVSNADGFFTVEEKSVTANEDSTENTDEQ